MKSSISQRWLTRLSALIALTPLAPVAAETDAKPPTTDAKNEPASYVLFTGRDIQIEHLRSLHHVRGVEGGSFIIQWNNRKLAIPMDRNSEKIKVSRLQVLTDRSATIANYQYDRVYTPGNDPQRKFAEQMRGLSALSELATMAERKARDTPETIEVADPNNPRATKQVTNPQFEANRAAAELASSQSSGSMGPGFYTQQLGESMAAELFDALAVQFEISAAKPIQKPYLVLTAKYREKDDTTHVRNWLFAKALPAIDATAVKIHVREGGFPPGFEVESLQIHVYEKGIEIATDLSENRAALTRDEAHEYLIIEHLAAHKGATVQPQVALFDLPVDWIARRHEAVFQKTYFVKVDKNGCTGGAFEDERCTTPVADPTCAEILNRMLFVPALADGQPVDAIARVTLAALAD